MKRKVGIFIDNFHMDDAFDAVRKAAEFGADAIQFHAKNQMDPQAMTTQRKNEFNQLVKDLGMNVCAVCGDVGGFKFPETTPNNVEKTKRIIDMALEFGTPIITGHIGVIPSAPAHPRYAMMRDACGEVAMYAEKAGAYYAIESGPETSWVMRGFLEDIGSKALCVNFDTANGVMITGENPGAAILNLRDHIKHVHIKDGVMNWFCDPEIAYGMIPDTQNLKAGHRDQRPLGQGNVPWETVFQALDTIAYNGFLTIEREGGEDRIVEIKNAVETLKTWNK